MKSQPQNPEFRINTENFHPCIRSASRYHPRYQSRSSMYTHGLIPRNFAELAEAVPIDFWPVFIFINTVYASSKGAGESAHMRIHCLTMQ